MRPILVTGFEPFGGLSYNPSEAALGLLPSTIGGHRVHKAVLPVDYQRLPQSLQALYALRPSLVLHTGLALQRPTLSVEQIGVNRLEFDLMDNGGSMVQGLPVVDGGREQLQVRMPVDQILNVLRRDGIAAASSGTAGLFLCNQALFYSLHHLDPEVQVGFVHLAPDETLAAELGVAYQPLAQQVQGLRVVLECCILARLFKPPGNRRSALI